MTGRPREIDREVLGELLGDFDMNPREIADFMECSVRSVFAIGSEMGYDMAHRRTLVTKQRRIRQLTQELEREREAFLNGS